MLSNMREREQIIQELRDTLINKELQLATIGLINKAIPLLENICTDIILQTKADIELYTITVHDLKDALANIGETKLANTAGRLGQAGDNKDITIISTKTPSFINELRLLADKYKHKEIKKNKEIEEISYDDMALLRETLKIIEKACKICDINKAETLLDDLKLRTWPRVVNDLLSAISENLSSGKLKDVISVINKFIYW
ncbi:MAG: hypothetical protein FWE14_08360 [Lachnospiraceae bacterium]|nr:hypothetical protein [Lachnospiraceae bacterium]